ncbi:MAG: hypothetical protein ACXV5J_00685 [Candidatus Angelobacter sp.]
MFKQTLKLVFSFPVFLGAVLAGCVYHLANRGVADPDIWWHLRNAEYLLNTHHFIRSDMYSFTVSGTPWINHEWLSEIPYYLAYRAWGLRGIFLVMVCLIEIVMLGVFYLGWLVSGNVKSAFLASWIAMLLATVSFGPRTLLVGWIFLIVLLALLWRYRMHGKDSLWALPPLFLLWVNSHGSWLIGVGILGIFIAAGLFHGPGGAQESARWSPAQLQRLLKIAALSVLALFINPYGYRLVFYPFDFMLRQNLNVSNVEEWVSVDFHSGRGKMLLATIFIVLALSILRRQRWSLESFALFLFAIYASVTYMRFLFLAGIIFTPLLASSLDMVPPYQREKDKPVINAAFAIAAILFAVFTFPSEQSLAEDIEKKYPTQAIGYLQSLPDHGSNRVLNEYLWGGYLISRCRNVPVFIDSRVDIFEYNGIVRDYLDFSNLKNSFAVLDKYNIQYALLTTNGPQTYLLKRDSQWHVIYRDDVATIFERGPQPAPRSLSADD